MSQETALPAVVQADMVDVYGLPTALRRRGTGRPLVYLHGAGMTGRWLPFHEALARGADVIAPEHPGFGATPLPDWLSGFDDLVLHYDDLRQVIGLDEPFDLVGYSLGGWIAAEYAVCYPDRLRSLTLIAPTGLSRPGGPPLTVDPFALAPETMAMTIFNDFSSIGEIMAGAQDLDAVIRMYEEQSALARLAWQRPYSRRLPRLLRRVQCPALVVVAGADRFLPDEVPGRYQELLPAARTVRIPSAGHALVVERPDDVARTVLDFLGSL
jgi:pimeloyl-ACP methyl ester carboxylesterase